MSCIADLETDGFCILDQRVAPDTIDALREACHTAFATHEEGVLAKSSRGHVYAARNLIDSIPEVATVWQTPGILKFLGAILGSDFGLVRALFFDKPPDRTWGLAWHKDTSIAVNDNSRVSPHFSRPTKKSGVPHVIASDEVLRSMLTLRIHLDPASEQNGALEVVPQSHVSSTASGVGVERATTVHAEAGQILAMRPLIIHGSKASLSDSKLHRRILHLEFAAAPTLPDGYAWYNFVAPK